VRSPKVLLQLDLEPNEKKACHRNLLHRPDLSRVFDGA
jgi:hypothetical protein